MRYMAIREDRLAELLGVLVKAVKISQGLANKIAEAVRESHQEIAQFQRQSMERLRRGYALIQGQPDKAYDDRLAGITDDSL